MKITEDKSTVLSNAGTAVNIEIGASRDAQVMIMNVLTNTLYTDKISAVWREYGCNGADANIEAGREVPIEITLPTKLRAEAVIRDFGRGMSERRMLDVYCKLGESTKRDNNDETGMIGIGAKVGFAYGEMFTVTTFNGGQKAIYQFFKEKGMPKMMPMGQESSDEPEGTEIRVPVRAEHIHEFTEKAERVFRYFRIPPVVHGSAIEYDRGHPVFKGNYWRLTGRSAVAVMGNVGYHVDKNTLGLDYGDTVRHLLDIGVELDFEIGELEISANREGLQYKDETRARIIAKARRVVGELADVFKAQIAGAKCLWDAKQAYADAFEKIGDVDKQTLRSVIDAKVSWNGKPLDSGRFNVDTEDADVSIVSFTKQTYGRRKIWRDTCDSVYPHKSLTLVLNDLPKLNIPPSRIKGHFANDAGASCVVVFTFKTKKARDKFWKEKEMEGAPFVSLSSLTPLLAVGGGSGTSNRKHSGHAFSLDETVTDSIYRNKNRSTWWTPEVVDLQGSGVYVGIDKFKVSNMEPDCFLSKVRDLRKVGLVKGKVYGFKHNAKIGKKWVLLADSLKGQTQASQAMADYLAAKRHDAFLFPTPSLPECVAKEYATAYAKMISLRMKLFDFLDDNGAAPWAKLPILPDASVDLAAMKDKVFERYPLLRWVMNSKNALTAIAEYVKMVEQR